MSAELDVLDPITSKVGDPPTQGQLEVAAKIGVDLTGKNPGSARHALNKAFRELANRLIVDKRLVPGMTCVYDGKTPSIIKKVGDAPPFYEGRGEIVLVTRQGSEGSLTKWIHPRWLSEHKLPKKIKDKKG
jgi:hypothetical protein